VIQEENERFNEPAIDHRAKCVSVLNEKNERNLRAEFDKYFQLGRWESLEFRPKSSLYNVLKYFRQKL